ncbi:Ribonuclease HI [uncultured archaeon]|nr:Ribonuclease HI [uncultured archaeon]
MLIIHTDGACFGNPGPMGIGVAAYHGRVLVRELSEYIGKGTNNIAEYTAVVKALELAKELGESEIEIRSDSELLIKQMNGEYKVKMPHLKELKAKIRVLEKGMKVKFKWVPREQNSAADLLSKEAIEKTVQ